MTSDTQENYMTMWMWGGAKSPAKNRGHTSAQHGGESGTPVSDHIRTEILTSRPAWVIEDPVSKSGERQPQNSSKTSASKSLLKIKN